MLGYGSRQRHPWMSAPMRSQVEIEKLSRSVCGTVADHGQSATIHRLLIARHCSIWGTRPTA